MLIKQDPANRSLLNDNQVLTNELVNVNRELTKLKAEGRVIGDTYKKSEKENLELKKSITEHHSQMQNTIEEKMEALLQKREKEESQANHREVAGDEQQRDAQQPIAMQAQIDEMKIMLASQSQEMTQKINQVAANQTETQ